MITHPMTEDMAGGGSQGQGEVETGMNHTWEGGKVVAAEADMRNTPLQGVTDRKVELGLNPERTCCHRTRNDMVCNVRTLSELKQYNICSIHGIC